MSKETVCCCIEHHAVLFALMAKHGVELCGERARTPDGLERPPAGR